MPAVSSDGADLEASRRRSRRGRRTRTSTASCRGSSSTRASCTRRVTSATRSSIGSGSCRSSPTTSTSSSRSASPGSAQQVRAGVTAMPRRRARPGGPAAGRPGAGPRARRRALGDLPRRSPRLRRAGVELLEYGEVPERPRGASPAVPRRDLPGPHAACSRSRASLPVHLDADAVDRRRAARPGDRRPPLRPREGPAGAAPVPGAGARPGQPSSHHRFVLLDQVIEANLDLLFSGMEIEEHHLFRVTRNADFDLEEDEADDLLLAIEEELRRRRFGEAVRLEVERTMPPSLREVLLARDRRLERPGLRGQRDARPDGPEPRRRPRPAGPASRPRGTPSRPPRLRRTTRTSRPTSSRQSARATSCSTTRTTASRRPSSASSPRLPTTPTCSPSSSRVYRTSGDSPIVAHLIRAAERGKQVVVLVEIKARFDEQANIAWARKLERAGAHVVYGLVGLKTHCKTMLVVRREAGGPAPLRAHRHRQLQPEDRPHVHGPRAAHLPAGARPGRDRPVQRPDRPLAASGPSAGCWSPRSGSASGSSRSSSARSAHAAAGRPASIVLKMNALVDRECIGRPLSGLGRRRRDRPDHPRGVHAHPRDRGPVGADPGSVDHRASSWSTHASGGSRTAASPEWYIGSADLMERNLDRRIEALTPILDPALQDRARRHPRRRCSPTTGGPGSSARTAAGHGSTGMALRDRRPTRTWSCDVAPPAPPGPPGSPSARTTWRRRWSHGREPARPRSSRQRSSSTSWSASRPARCSAARTSPACRASGAPRTVRQLDQYLDTADGRLRRAGWAARLRAVGGESRIQLKSNRRTGRRRDPAAHRARRPGGPGRGSRIVAALGRPPPAAPAARRRADRADGHAPPGPPRS